MTESETVPTFRERVEAGAAYLDGVLPGWWEKIDLETLDLKSGCRCVLGQLAVDVSATTQDIEGMIFAKNDGFSAWISGYLPVDAIDYDEAMACGFDVYDFEMEDEDANYEALDTAWRTYITERRASVTDKPPVMVPKEQAHLLVVERGDTKVTIDTRPGDHSVLDVRCVAERILSKLLTDAITLRTYSDGTTVIHADGITVDLDPAELALIQRLIAEDSE